MLSISHNVQCCLDTLGLFLFQVTRVRRQVSWVAFLNLPNMCLQNKSERNWWHSYLNLWIRSSVQAGWQRVIVSQQNTQDYPSHGKKTQSNRDGLKQGH